MRKTTALGSRKREHILRAAEREFERVGFNGARMQNIADQANVPKANIHYYFKNKQALYDAVLSNVVALWNNALAPIESNDDPAVVLENYIRMKVEFSRLYPSATRIFALELLNGGAHLSPQLIAETRKWTRQRAEEFTGWIKEKKILPIDPYHLIFMIWATTQQYADAETQITAIYKKKKLAKQDFDHLADSLTTMIFRICGIKPIDKAS